MSISHIKSNTIGDFSGTVTVFNSAGSTVTANATDLVRPSDWNSVHNQYMTLSGNTGGVSTVSGTNLIFQGGNNVTLSGTGQTIVISGGPAGNTMSVSAGNGSFASNAITFADSNGVTFSSGTQGIYASVKTDYAGTGTSATNATVTMNSDGLAISVGTAAPSPVNISAGTTSNNLQTLIFSNSNGVSFGLNGSTITASASGGGGNTMTVSAANGTFQSNAITFADSNGLSFSTGTQGIYGTVKTDYAGTGTTFNGANASASITLNSNGFNMSLSAAASGAGDGYNIVSASGNTAGTLTSYSTGTVVLAGGDNITLSQSSNSISINAPPTSQFTVSGNASLSSAGSTISIGANAAAVSIGGNSTSGGAGYSNVSTGTVVLMGDSNVTLSQDGASVYISAGAGTGGNTMTVSAANGTFQSNAITFANSNGVSFSTGTQGVYGTVKTDYAGTGTSATNASITLNSNGLAISVGAGTGGGIAAANSQTTYTSGTVNFLEGGGAITIASTTGQKFNFSVPATSSLSAEANITIGTTGSTIGFSVGTAAPSPVNMSAGTTSNNLQTVVFSNSNNFSFGLNGSTITGSYTVPTLTSFSVQDSATTLNPVARLAFSTGNNITMSLSTGASSATVGVAHNLAGTSTGFTGANISASMTHNSSGLALSMSVAAGGGGSVNFSAGTTSNNLAAITFSNSNGISFGLNGSTITGSHNALTSQSNQAVSGANGSFTFQTLTFANSNGVSWSTGTQGLYASVNAGGVAVAASNTTFTSGTVVLSNNGGALTIGSGAQSVLFSVPATSSLSAGANITISTNGSTISIIGASVAPAPVNFSAGTTSGNLGSVVFSNSNRVSFGLNGSTITGSADYYPRVSSAGAGDVSPVWGSYDMYVRSALTTGPTINNPSGTPTEGEAFMLKLVDTGGGFALAFGTSYVAYGTALPTSIGSSKEMLVMCQYDAVRSLIDVYPAIQET